MFPSSASPFSTRFAASLFFGFAALLSTSPTANASAHTESTYAVLHFYGDGPLLEAREDPVISPGRVSGHVHTIQGSNAMNLTMGDNFDEIANCTTGRVNKDKSNYWSPKLYFKSPSNGTFYDVPLYYSNVYYFFDATDDDMIPFPPGFRMVSGNPNLRSPPAGGADLQLDASKGAIQAVGWVCPRKETTPPAWPADSTGWPIGMQSNVVGQGVGFPNVNCDGLYSPLRADIHFPSCITQDESKIDNYTENTAWPSVSNTTGRWNCPSGYSHVPHLFYEFYWNTQLFEGQWETGGDSQPFLLAQGDPTGYGLHADFISGWDTEALQYVIDNCDAGDSGMDTCTGIPGGTVTGSDNPASCHVAAPFTEKITGPLAALPGCNPVSPGPALATMIMDCASDPKITGPFPGGIASATSTTSGSTSSTTSSSTKTTASTTTTTTAAANNVATSSHSSNTTGATGTTTTTTKSSSTTTHHHHHHHKHHERLLTKRHRV